MENTNSQANAASQQEYIDIAAMFKTLWQRRKVFYWLWPVTFVVSAALILCVPRYYTCEVVLAPEVQSNTSGSLQSLASSFGFDMQRTGADAIYPTIYPDMVSSPDFLVKLFDIPIKTSDGEYEGTYYDYVAKHQKRPFWTSWKYAIITWIMPKEPEQTFGQKGQDGVDLFSLTKAQKGAIRHMQENITCKVDKKTDVITFSVTAQDKLVCALMADSVCTALQTAITDYRTQKAKIDLLYYEKMMNEAYGEYQQASNRYIRYADSHSGMNLEQYRIAATNLEREMQIKQSAYTSFQKQYLATQARIQENTPAYTILQSASVPMKAAGPRRVMFVLAMLFLATCVAGCIICKDQLMAIFL